MSGEAYDFWYRALEGDEGNGVVLEDARKCTEMMAVICRDYAWGSACDSCFDCAKLRAAAALDAFFETKDPRIGAAVMRDSAQNMCRRCYESQWAKERPRKLSPLLETKS